MLAGFNEWSLEFVLRMLLSVIYFIAGAMKIFDMSGFYRILKNYKMFSGLACELTAFFLPILQVVLGILLFTKSFSFVVLLFTTFIQLFLVIFTIVAIKTRGQVRNCGMWGTAVNVPLSWKVVLLNIFLFFASSFLLLRLLVGLSV